MKNKILLIIFSFFTFFLFFDNVNAIAVEDTNPFILNYEDFEDFSDMYGNYTFSEFVDLLIDTYDSNKTSSSPNLLITFTRWTPSASSSVTIRTYFVSDQPVYWFFAPTRVGRSTGNTVLNANLSFNQSYAINTFTVGESDYSLLLQDFINDLSSVESFNDYTFISDQVTFGSNNKRASVGGGVIYYSGNSSRVIYGMPESFINSTTNYPYWNLTYNDSLITLGDHLPTYYEYLGLSSPPTDEPDLPEPDDISINKYTNNYYGFMLSQIPVSNIYEYEVRFTVGQRLIYSDINYQFNLFGRINHGTYFTYEPITCTVGTSNEDPYFGSENFLDSFNVYQSKTFGIMDCSSDLTKYDYVYVNAFNENFDDNDITYFGYTSNYGYVNVNDFIANPIKLIDYFTFTKTSNMFVSSNCTSCSLYYGSSNLNNFVYSSYDLTTFKHQNHFISSPVNSKFVNFEKFEYIGQNTNQGIGFNLYSNYDSGNLYILVDSDNLVSFDSNISSNNNFTYIDSTGNVINNNFDVFYSYDPNVGTNVDSYFGIVSTYIDSISSDIKSISNVFQHVYDLAPEILQTLILVFYVLAMSYILFKIIRK